jgi:putative FmdB family regulatory protein
VPIYEYQCRECKHKFDALQKVGEDGSELRCPKCGADNPTKELSVFARSDSAGKPSSSCSTGKGFS